MDVYKVLLEVFLVSVLFVVILGDWSTFSFFLL